MGATTTNYKFNEEYAVLGLSASAFKDVVFFRVAAPLRQIELRYGEIADKYKFETFYQRF